MPWRRRRAVDREPMRRDDRRQSAATPPSRLRVLPVRRRDGCHVAAPAPTACRPPHPGPSPDDRRRLSRAEPRISRGGPGADRKSRRGEGDSGRLLRVTASRAPAATSSGRILRHHRGARSWCGVGEVWTPRSAAGASLRVRVLRQKPRLGRGARRCTAWSTAFRRYRLPFATVQNEAAVRPQNRGCPPAWYRWGRSPSPSRAAVSHVGVI